MYVPSFSFLGLIVPEKSATNIFPKKGLHTNIYGKDKNYIPLIYFVHQGYNDLLTSITTNKMACTPSEDSDQPGHPPCLIRVFAVRMKKAWVLSYPLSAQQRLWSDWVDAQADLSLCWAHRSFCWFCHEAAQILSITMYFHFTHNYQICLAQCVVNVL